MKRQVKAELLDSLPPDDRRAVHSRADLRKVNWWMGHAGLISRLLREAFAEAPPRSVVELGAGDGTLLLRLASQLAPRWKPARVLLVDRQGLPTPATRSRFASLGWPVESEPGDVFEWLERPGPESYDLCLANLFLHHFEDEPLRRLLSRVAQQARVFLACDPRRGRFPLAATGLLPLLGCNAVSVHDGRISVRAGFAGKELSALWPDNGGSARLSNPAPQSHWRLMERRAGLFSHCFLARRSE